MKELKISAIREGTVIDHIPPKSVFKIVDILGLKDHNNVVSVGMNLESKKMGKKGLIKVGGRNLTEAEANKITLLAPYATVSIIKDYNVVKKLKLHLPKEVNNIIECNNPKCITNMEKVPTKFSIISDNPMRVRCNYCERIMEEIKLI